MNENTRKKAILVQEMLDKYYEPERQDRCKLWVYRNYIRKAIPMSERTFWRYCARDVENNKKVEENKDQLKLWD
ncbi:MAG TPA: hypothetical protein GXZ87_07585 [Bacteroidales bacterium]|nr:hypothetical protein [Bacteroidales bacterium]